MATFISKDLSILKCLYSFCLACSRSKTLAERGPDLDMFQRRFLATVPVSATAVTWCWCCCSAGVLLAQCFRCRLRWVLADAYNGFDHGLQCTFRQTGLSLSRRKLDAISICG